MDLSSASAAHRPVISMRACHTAQHWSGCLFIGAFAGVLLRQEGRRIEQWVACSAIQPLALCNQVGGVRGTNFECDPVNFFSAAYVHVRPRVTALSLKVANKDDVLISA